MNTFAICTNKIRDTTWLELSEPFSHSLPHVFAQIGQMGPGAFSEGTLANFHAVSLNSCRPNLYTVSKIPDCSYSNLFSPRVAQLTYCYLHLYLSVWAPNNFRSAGFQFYPATLRRVKHLEWDRFEPRSSFVRWTRDHSNNYTFFTQSERIEPVLPQTAQHSKASLFNCFYKTQVKKHLLEGPD